MNRDGNREHIVIVGGGFGGLELARALRKSPVLVTLVDRHNYHLFQPLLYQVATGALSPANIASPLRNVLRRQHNVRVLLGEVKTIDVPARRLMLDDNWLSYDTLVLAAGSSHSYFGHDEWASLAPGLKSIDDATDIRRRVLLAFEHAEKSRGESHGELLTFVVIGAGPTGVELAGALAEIAKDTLRHEFRTIDPTTANVILVEGADRVLPTYPPELSARALQALEQLGVQVRTGTRATQIDPTGVVLAQGDHEQRIATRNVLWAAGVEASPLGRALADATEATLDRAGRVSVKQDFTIPGHPEIFVIGDMASYSAADGKPLPAVAPVAIQEGKYVAQLINARLTSAPEPPLFAYKDWGMMATIGRMRGVAELRGWRFSGASAWLIWLFVHLMQIARFENRLLVLIQWAWHFLTRNRSARLITGNETSRLADCPPLEPATLEPKPGP